LLEDHLLTSADTTVPIARGQDLLRRDRTITNTDRAVHTVLKSIKNTKNGIARSLVIWTAH